MLRDYVKVLLAMSLCTSTVGANVAADDKLPCTQSVYLTFDTGHMGVAPLIAEVLARHHVLVTFFAANEATQEGDGSLGDHWAPWWRARGKEGHAFASHTFNHVYWQSDVDRSDFRVKPSAGPRAGKSYVVDSAAYCAELTHAAQRLESITGVKPLALFRAPGGKTSPALESVAQTCGYRHVGWSKAGFLGDELPSEKFSNAKLLAQSLRDIRSGDILLAHLGIWSRRDPWAPAVLEPLIVGLKQKGFCFKTLRDHPVFGNSGQR
jgi:peptidoglycan/xylan/chitin deacetylase (PgdA/CDA1 family)